jgi:hypothetical protein
LGWTGQDRTGKWDGQDKKDWRRGLDSTIPEAWRSSQLSTSHGPWPVGEVDKAGKDRTGKWAGQDKTGQDRTGLENRLDNTIPVAWRSSQLIASHGPWLVGAVDKTGQDRTGQDWKMGWTGEDRKMGWIVQFLKPGDPAS